MVTIPVIHLLCPAQTKEPESGAAEVPVSDNGTVHLSPRPNRPWLNEMAAIVQRCDMEGRPSDGGADDEGDTGASASP